MNRINKQFLKSLKGIIRDQLGQKNTIQIADVGIFKLRHRAQYQEQREDGRVVMQPPKDYVEFVPENKENE